MFYLTPSQMKAAENYSDKNGITYKVLMENAGKTAAKIISDKCSTENGVVILCGKGNNGGDGFVAANELNLNGIKATVVLLCGNPATELAGQEFSALNDDVNIIYAHEREKIFASIKVCSVIVDAVYGTGFHGTLNDDIAEIFEFAAKECSAEIVAFDVPSGGNCYDGSVSRGTPDCKYTITFGYEKTGMLSFPLDKKCGEIIDADIGFTSDCIKNIKYAAKKFEKSVLKGLFPPRPENSYKNMYGKLLIVAGCRKMSGAASMATLAALRSGAGIVTLASVKDVINRTAARIYEPTFLPLEEDESGAVSAKSVSEIIAAAEKSTAVEIGSGLSFTDGTKTVVSEIIKNVNCPIIADADGINCIASDINIIRNTKNKLIVTPHTGELKRLYSASFGENKTMPDRLTAASELSEKYGITVAAKGNPTFITDNGRAYVCKVGNPGLSRGGSGDVLAGIISGFVAQKLPVFEAVSAAVFVHGKAADIAAEEFSEQCMLPTDVINKMSDVFKNMAD